MTSVRPATVGRTPSDARTRGRTRLADVAIGVFAALFIVGVVLTVSRGAAALQHVAETGQPGLLILRADHQAPARWTIGPGDTVHWHVEASLSDAPSGTLELELRAEGPLVVNAGLTARVDTCTAPFTRDSTNPGAAPECAGETHTILSEIPLTQIATADAGDRHRLADLHAGHPRHLLITFALPADSDPALIDGAHAELGAGLHVRDNTPDRPDELPATGADVLATALFGVGLLGLGASIAARRAVNAAAASKAQPPSKAQS